jgi:sporulation protein YlmC with PRC-barrel domain
MRASELIGAPVFDHSGEQVGVVRDLRVAVEQPAAGGGFPIVGLVLSQSGARSAAAHAWGFAQGRAEGPPLLRRLLGRAAVRSILIPAERVLEWGPGGVRIDGDAEARRSA